VPAALRITDGNPVWLSQSILPSKDTVVSAGMSPTLAAILINSQDVFVYVKVDNTGTDDIGPCACTVAVPAPWPSSPFFSGYRAGPPTSSVTDTNAASGTTFAQGPFDDSISGPGGFNHSFGLSAGQRAWGWSPDARFFALARASSLNGSDWNLTILALQSTQRPNGTTIAKGQNAASTSGVFGGPWTNQSFFRWAASHAVLVAGAYAGGGTIVTVICPYAPNGASWGNILPPTPGQIDWAFLNSLCGSVVALVPKILVLPNPRDIEVISTATAMQTSFKQNNVSTSVTITGPNPTITTKSHGANGVEIFTGTGTVKVTVDDPDCTSVVGGGVLARVDRVKASTLPTANLGVQGVGVSVASLIKQGQSKWVQVPNQNVSGWANQGEPHWCLLAQAYTQDLTTISRPWNGQATSPPPFPIGLVNCAQRNVMIS
jgi:hypothetical protein